MERVLFVLLAAVAFNITACGEEEADECSERDTELLRCECQCLRWHGSPETAAYTECMNICAPPAHTIDIPEENCLDKLIGWQDREECADAANQCECVEQTLEHYRWAWLDDFMAKEKCLGTMLAKDAEKRGCYLYDGAGGVTHFCECVRHLKKHRK